MDSFVEKAKSWLTRAKDAFLQAWDRMTEEDRTVFIIAGACEVVGLLIGGIIGAGAIFALTMMLSLGLLLYSFPKACRFVAKYRYIIDAVVTIWLLFVGFLTGSVTLVVGLMFFGLCLSAYLRVMQGFYGEEPPENQAPEVTA